MSAQNSVPAPGKDQDHPNGSSSGQPTVRHIPIYVEGRDDPIINTSTDPASGNNNKNIHTKNGSHQVPQGPGQSEFLQNSASGNSIFNRVKSFPVRTGFDSDFFQGHSNHFGQRANSPGRQQQVPVNVARRSASPAQVHRPHTPQTTQTTSAGGDAATTSTKNPIIGAQGHPQGHPLGGDPSIGKIQSIQRDVLALMDQVEKFDGTSKTDKKYLYLDEMLTQNLLKLDTIDTDGKENIKQARREAIKCINICIAALEKKAEAAAAAGRRGQ